MPNQELSVSTIVSCEWLKNHQDLEHLIVLHAGIHSEVPVLIPGARFVNVKERFSDRSAEFPNTIPSTLQFEREVQNLGINKNSTVIVYDAKGMYWSPRVWWLFKTYGFDNVAVLDGGLPEWLRLEYPTVAHVEPNSWAIGNFKAAYQALKMKFHEDIIDISTNNTGIILDARSEERFKSLVSEPREGLRRGHIPNSKNLPYTELFDGYCFKSKQALKSIFESFQIGDRSLTFSCGSGITACILALAAEISGYDDLSVYDGSWTEYGTLTN